MQQLVKVMARGQSYGAENQKANLVRLGSSLMKRSMNAGEARRKPSMLRIVIADDHPLFRDAIRLALNDLDAPEGLDVVEAASAHDAKQLADSQPDLDLLLLDLRMPGMDGLQGLVDLRQQHPSLPIVVVSASDDALVVRECLALGAMGYIPKCYDKTAITEAIHNVLEGAVHRPPYLVLPGLAEESSGASEPAVTQAIAALTPQQMRVLKAVAKGLPNKIIAYDLGIAEKTVKAHVTVILKKLGVSNRTQAVLVVKDLFDT